MIMGSIAMKYDLIEENADCIHYEISGEFELEEAEASIKKIHDHCLKKNIDMVLFDVTKKEGTRKTSDLFSLGEFIAKLFRNTIKFALVARKDQANTFVEDVAVNRGARFKIFLDKNEAIKWLRNDGK